jgi:hypothetical protein
VVVANDAGSFNGSNNKFTGYSYSTNGGASFTDGGSLPTSAIGDAGDPTLARNETTGHFSPLGFDLPGRFKCFIRRQRRHLVGAGQRDARRG